MALIELKKARVVLEGSAVFESLDFALQSGQSVSVTGENGAGKTTFLRLLGGDIWPVRAESRFYCFGDKPTWSPLRARQQIAFVSPLAQERVVRLSQDGADGERGARLSVRECLSTGLFDSFLLHQKPDKEQGAQVESMLARFSLDELANRELQTLSQGQLRRVLLARALVKGPRVVLLDEAASGLDAVARTELFGALESLDQSGATFVFASHRPEELPAWATRWTIESGRIEREVATGADLKKALTRPQKPAGGLQLAPAFAQTTPSIAQTTPSIAQTAPAIAQTMPVTAQTAPSIAQTMPAIAQASSAIAQTMPVTAQTAPSIAQTAPVTAQTAPAIAQTAPVIAQRRLVIPTERSDEESTFASPFATDERLPLDSSSLRSVGMTSLRCAITGVVCAMAGASDEGTTRAIDEAKPVADERLPLDSPSLRSFAVTGAGCEAAGASDEDTTRATEEAKRATPLFQLQNVSVFLDGAPILCDLNWVWRRGAHWRILGENGSGKTTFLRLLGGELPPALGGEVVRLGQSARPIWEWRRRIALVSPLLQARFHDALSVRDAVASGWEGGFMAPRELSSAQQSAVEDALDEWKLRELETRRFDRLSYGQTRRVLLARALVASPEVVLLDEALDGLDEATRGFCFDKWEQLAQRGTHFAFASHHEIDFPAWTNGEVRLEEGRLNVVSRVYCQSG